MTQIPASGSGNFQQTIYNVYQYRSAQNQSGDYAQPLNYDRHGYPVYTSAVRQLVYTGIDTWNKGGYDYSDYANTTRRSPLDHQEPKVIVNYIANNPGSPVAATPIAIANYAISTGLIYVGNNNGNYGGVKVGQVFPGGYNGY